MKKLLFFLLFCCTFSAYSQQRVGLFVHTDKTIYAKNETIWFSGYLLGTAEHQSRHSLLNVVISSADSGKVLVEEKYAMDHGISIGKLILPDSIKDGIYKFIAYTDVLGPASKPQASFSTTLTIGNRFGTATPNASLNTRSMQEGKAQLSTDRPAYRKREKVRLKVKLQDQSLFSVAAVYHTRLNDDQKRIMESSVNTTENISEDQQQPLTLSVKNKNKTLDKAIDVVLFGNNGIKILSTDKIGLLKLERNTLLSPYGKKVAVMVSGQKAKDYQIELHNPMLETGILLAKENIMPAAQLISRKHSRQQSLQNAMEKIVELNAVTIKGTNNSSILRGKPGVNDCGDWVDEYDYLNYPYSEKRYHPIIGKLYKKRTDIDQFMRSFKVEPIYYTGCEGAAQKTATLIKGVNLETPFYGLDKSSSQLQYLTTVFWGAGLLSNADGEAELSFSTADLSGEYRIILQGITDKGVCYGEVTFVVK